jgi:replicative DNA helicase
VNKQPAPEFGKKVLSLLLYNDMFFDSVIYVLDKDVFTHPVVSNTVNTIKLYFENYQARPNPDLLIDFVVTILSKSRKYNLGAEAGADVIDLIKELQRPDPDTNSNINYYKSRILDFAKRTKVLKAQAEISKIVEDPAADLSIIPHMMYDAISSYDEEQDSVIDVTYATPNDLIQTTIEASGQDAISTGYPYIDAGLGGGICREEMAFFYGPPGSCKSTLAHIIGLNMAYSGNNVLLFNLEMMEKKLTKRVVKTITGGTELDILDDPTAYVNKLWKKMQYEPLGVLGRTSNVPNIMDILRTTYNPPDIDHIKELLTMYTQTLESKEKAQDPSSIYDCEIIKKEIRKELLLSYNSSFDIDFENNVLYARRGSEYMRDPHLIAPMGHYYLYRPRIAFNMEYLEYKIRQYRNQGIKMDSVIVDYIDLMIDERSGKERWELIERTTKGFKKLLGKYKAAGISLSQVDTASRQKLREGSGLLQGFDAARSKGKEFDADIIGTINQTPALLKENRMLLYFPKVRDGAGHFAVQFKLDLEHMMIRQEQYFEKVDDTILQMWSSGHTSYKKPSASQEEYKISLNKMLGEES